MKKAGFTLTELMVTISIIGILAVVSLPAYTHFLHNWQLNGEADQLAGVMRAARAAAIMKNINAVFSFDMDANTFFYFEDNDRDGSRDNSEYRSATFTLPPSVEISAHTLGGTILTFGAMGNTAANGTITLRNVNNRTRRVRIFGGTGNIIVD